MYVYVYMYIYTYMLVCAYIQANISLVPHQVICLVTYLWAYVHGYGFIAIN